jgi:MFS family permease
MSFSVKRNLTALYLIKVAKWMNLVMPIVVLFYKSNGLNMRDIFLLTSVYSITLMTLEIPMGYFADTVGRKQSILSGVILGFFGYFTYSLSFGFWQFVFAEVLLGMGQSLVSGADSALLYDTLVAGKITEKYTRFEGKVTSVGNFAESLAGIAGGFIALSTLRTPFYFQTAVALIGVPAAIILKEPPVHIALHKPSVKDVFQITFEALHGNRKLKWNTLFSAVTGVSTLTMAWFAQPYFILVKLPLAWFGAAWAVLNFAVGLSSLYAWRIERILKPEKTVILFSVVLVFSYFLIPLAVPYAGLSILGLFYLARGLATPTLRNYINSITTSDVRATVLSVRNFVIRLLFAILGPVFGWITDRHGLHFALTFAGVVFGLMSGISLFFFLKYRTYRAD